MNCLDFRRQKLADPRRLSDEARSHVASCAACAAYAAEVDETERALDRAFDVGVPEGLADRMLFESARPRRPWRLWALAASVALVVAVSLFSFDSAKDRNRYARLAIEHVVMEPESLSSLRNADAQAFRKVVAQFGGTVKEMPGTIRYIRLCPMEDGMGWHVVLDTPQGLVTLLLVPGKPLRKAQSASAEGWSAVAQPAARGYYAVVTGSASASAYAVRMLDECIDWGGGKVAS